MAAVEVLLVVVVECLVHGEEEWKSLGDPHPSLVAVAVCAVAVAVVLAVVESFLHVVVPADEWLLLLPPLLLLGLLLHLPELDCAVELPAPELVGAVALLLLQQLLLVVAVAVLVLLPAVVLLLPAVGVLLRLLLPGVAAQLLLVLLLLPAVVLLLLLAVVLLLLLLAVVLLLLLLAVVLLLLLPLVAAVDDVRVVSPRRGRAVEPCPARGPPWHRGRPAPP